MCKDTSLTTSICKNYKKTKCKFCSVFKEIVNDSLYCIHLKFGNYKVLMFWGLGKFIKA